MRRLCRVVAALLIPTASLTEVLVAVGMARPPRALGKPYSAAR
jgi:hypothetical protein